MAMAVLLLALAFLNFSPSRSGAMDVLNELAPIAETAEAEAGPIPVKIMVRVLAADMGFSKSFTGNETEHELYPIRGALVFVMEGDALMGSLLDVPKVGYFGFTDADGEVILLSPRGNVTLVVNPRPYDPFMRSPRPPYSQDPRLFWKASVDVDGNETFVVKFFLYRVNPMKIYVNLRPSAPETHVTLRFKLPLNGSYYIGSPIVVHHTSSGDIAVYREELGSSLSLRELPWIAENFWINPRIIYSESYAGGAEVMEVIAIPSLSAYILSRMTYLPVERVILEELESR